MKKTLIKSSLFIAFVMLLASCKKFEAINVDPTAASESQVQVEYFIDNSIIHAQQNPSVSERAFVLYWVAGGHQISDADGATFSVGAYNDEWIGEYYDNQSGALNTINSAIDVATQQITDKTDKPYTNDLLQVARIWRAYLLSEMSDNFGPMPIEGFQGKNPAFVDVKSVYYYILDELKDATSKLDVSVTGLPAVVTKEDPAYGFNFTQWRKYGTSLRMRLAMRLSGVDAAKAQSEFEDAAKGDLMTDNADIFQIQETGGYNDLSGMYSRCYYLLPVAVSLNNLMVNLGGVKTQDQLPGIIAGGATALAAADAKIKPAGYVGQYYPFQFGTMTNNPVTGYFFDGLPNTIDPRAYQLFYIPGNTSSPSFPSAGNCGGVDAIATGARLRNASNDVVKTIDATYTWNPVPDGQWSTGQVNSKNDLLNIGGSNGFVPSLKNQFRTQTSKRVFFAPWETYFLLAEADVRGWATPVDAKTAYEKGITSSFEYWNIPIGNYLTSDDYNTDGTSVDWDNTTEPGNSHMMSYVDGMTGTPGTVSIKYPVNNLYMNGTVRNDQLTKIITQKFIAQTPWLPLETWSDHRRLGLPFWENVVLEAPITTLPALTSSNYMTSQQQFFPQRMKYPASLQNSNIDGYKQAVSDLKGGDNVLTPLWWAQQ
ncbi:MAG: SusD/RagB family nutrient-binding outer membrane lipoprotein [Ginsengibacter sp.]